MTDDDGRPDNGAPVSSFPDGAGTTSSPSGAGPVSGAGTPPAAEPDRSAGPSTGAGPDRSAGPSTGAGPDRSAGPSTGAGPDGSAGPVTGAGEDRDTGSDRGSGSGVPGRIRLRLDLSYDGTDFSGWAVQPGRRTVAGVLGDALHTLLRAPVPLVVAGRTDAGVHALGQVAHIDVDPAGLAALTPRRSGLPAETAGMVGLSRRLAGLLPADVRVREIRLAAPGFDARFAALRRHYVYRIGTAEWGVPPLDRACVLALRRALDVTAMQRSAAALLGLHDFAAFCRPREGATTIRELQRLDVQRRADQEVQLAVSADAFCHSMVRALVGALIAVGQGRAPVEMPAAVLAAGVRTAAVHVAPAHGLTLSAVEYPPDADLAARSGATRATRSADEVG